MKNFAVIFDMDGVICHTNPYHAKAFASFFDKYQIPHSETEFEAHMYGKHNSHIFSHFFKRTIAGEELLRMEAEKEGLFREIYQSHVETIPQYMGFLESLKQQHIKTAVATSAPRSNMDLILQTLGIVEKMESLLASEDVSLHKPHPEVYLKSAANLGMEPQHCLVFEDSFSGITAAQNAGMKVVAVLSSHTKAQLPACDAYITTYKDISLATIEALFAAK